MEQYVILQNGVKMPRIGYGTYKCTDGSDERVVRMALDAGYRMLDTAAFYGNEAYVGKAVRESGIPRKELFLTSKVWKSDLGYEKTKKSVEESLERLQTDYLDLCLIHWPKPDPESTDWKELDRGELEGAGGIVPPGNGARHRSQQFSAPSSGGFDGSCGGASHGGPAGTARRLPAGGGGAVLQILGDPGAGVEPAWEEARAGRAHGRGDGSEISGVSGTVSAWVFAAAEYRRDPQGVLHGTDAPESGTAGIRDYGRRHASAALPAAGGMERRASGSGTRAGLNLFKCSEKQPFCIRWWF